MLSKVFVVSLFVVGIAADLVVSDTASVLDGNVSESQVLRFWQTEGAVEESEDNEDDGDDCILIDWIENWTYVKGANFAINQANKRNILQHFKKVFDPFNVVTDIPFEFNIPVGETQYRISMQAKGFSVRWFGNPLVKPIHALSSTELALGLDLSKIIARTKFKATFELADENSEDTAGILGREWTGTAVFDIEKPQFEMEADIRTYKCTGPPMARARCVARSLRNKFSSLLDLRITEAIAGSLESVEMQAFDLKFQKATVDLRIDKKRGKPRSNLVNKVLGSEDMTEWYQEVRERISDVAVEALNNDLDKLSRNFKGRCYRRRK